MVAMQFYWLVLGILCVWRVTHLLNAEDGPWDVVVRLRRHAGKGFWGELMDCFYCLSLWVAAPLAVALGSGVQERLLLWPALSAGAILLERLTAGRPAAIQGVYFEDRENANLLREQQTQPGRNASAANAGPESSAGGHSGDGRS
jgi:hypothetical protein